MSMYRVWIEVNINGEIIRSISTKVYVRKGYAERIAKQIADRWAVKGCPAKCIVSGATYEDNPWKGESEQ